MDALLASLGLSFHAPRFAEEDLTPELLGTIPGGDLWDKAMEELGVDASAGKRLRSAVLAGASATASSASAPSDPAASAPAEVGSQPPSSSAAAPPAAPAAAPPRGMQFVDLDTGELRPAAWCHARDCCACEARARSGAKVAKVGAHCADIG